MDGFLLSELEELSREIRRMNAEAEKLAKEGRR
jgi:hypothetical protein